MSDLSFEGPMRDDVETMLMDPLHEMIEHAVDTGETRGIYLEEWPFGTPPRWRMSFSPTVKQGQIFRIQHEES